MDTTETIEILTQLQDIFNATVNASILKIAPWTPREHSTKVEALAIVPAGCTITVVIGDETRPIDGTGVKGLPETRLTEFGVEFDFNVKNLIIDADESLIVSLMSLGSEALWWSGEGVGVEKFHVSAGIEIGKVLKRGATLTLQICNPTDRPLMFRSAKIVGTERRIP